ncbi:hypothetical protein FGO68_gene16730 [Halteria grandinella]|uniref:Uncharacterized protein n=1 Tax=Halteria grandinella TaxID=5974 RepID=A0A8J8NXM7_HALGN|nr:hypothetical protein FGO68_gene16730 [Halteria grandinella]
MLRTSQSDSQSSQDVTYINVRDRIIEPTTEIEKQSSFLIDMVYTSDYRTTGVLEDFQLFIQLSIGLLNKKLITTYTSILTNPLQFLHQLLSNPFDSLLTQDFTLFKSAIGYSRVRIDRRTTKDLVTRSGYEYECHSVPTDDGYIVHLHRIPNPSSFNITYFQHGALDNCATWVLHGPHDGLAFKAREEGARVTRACIYGHHLESEGCDVFLGNFRGNCPREVEGWRKKQCYWEEVHLEGYAYRDLCAFIRRIREIKRDDLVRIYGELGIKCSKDQLERDLDKRLKITFVGHSLGGLTLFMYLIKKREQSLPHYINNAILLSPAGFHHETSAYLKFYNWLGASILPFLSHSISFPTYLIELIQKVHQDLITIPATRDLCSLLAQSLLGGKRTFSNQAVSNPHPIWKSALIMNSVFKFGLSTNLCKQFYQMFGQEKNIIPQLESKKGWTDWAISKVWKTVLKVDEKISDVDLSEGYGLIDIPISLFISMDDDLIKPTDVIKHYHNLKSNEKDVEVHLFEGFSHIDFTYASHHLIIEEFLKVLRQSFQ